MYVYFCRDFVCDSHRWCDRGFHHDECVYVRKYIPVLLFFRFLNDFYKISLYILHSEKNGVK